MGRVVIEVITTHKELGNFRQELTKEQLAQGLGFIPTMGNLHEGHLGLLERSLEVHGVNVVSIFVNPKQFGPQEDFHRYPRTPEADLAKIKGLLQLRSEYQNKKVAVFLPSSVDEIFPPGYDTTISVGALTRILCGKSRPGHFDGVTTVVHRLFAMIRPTHAYFGEKDYQQLLVIKKMVKDLLMNIEIVPVPIFMAPDNLALSSRNQYLGREERGSALELSKTLAQVKEMLLNQKQKHFTWIVQESFQQLKEEKLKTGNWDYLELLRSVDLTSPPIGEKELVVLGALRVGRTRLIDNVLINLNQI